MISRNPFIVQVGTKQGRHPKFQKYDMIQLSIAAMGTHGTKFRHGENLVVLGTIEGPNPNEVRYEVCGPWSENEGKWKYKGLLDDSMKFRRVQMPASIVENFGTKVGYLNFSKLKYDYYRS